MASNESVIPLCLQQAVIDVFKIQVDMDIKVTSVAMTDAAKTADPVDCMSVLGMKSSDFTGSIALGFSSATFLKILEKMLGEVYTEVTDQNADACSELLNMIYASARVKINQGGFDFQPAIPTAIRGHDLTIAQGASSRFLSFKCESDKGSFLLALNLKRSSR